MKTNENKQGLPNNIPNISLISSQISEALNLDELKSIADRLARDYQIFPHGNILELARELVKFCQRRGKIQELLDLVKDTNPVFENNFSYTLPQENLTEDRIEELTGEMEKAKEQLQKLHEDQNDFTGDSIWANHNRRR
jgi:hypothetical protein